MKLVIEDGSGTRSTVPFAGEEITVGRATEGVTFRLGERNVSRRHARFVLASGTVFVEDLGSTTGTRVNGERITGRRKLRGGDLVQIGDYDVAVLEDASAEPPGAPPPLPAAPAPRAPAAAPVPAPAPPAPARTAPAPAVEPRAAAAPATPAAPAPRRSGGLRAALLAGGIALALGIGAGWLVGRLLAPPPPAPAPAAQRGP
jgi:ribosome-associated protein YbcJ (S4-like RNA binding protein)